MKHLVLILTGCMVLAGCAPADSVKKPVAENPLNADFTTLSACRGACRRQGHERGECKRISEVNTDDSPAGSCAVSGSSQCGKEGLCKCYCSGERKLSTDPAAVEKITVKQGGTFTIPLTSNPTTGFSWVAEFNDTALTLVEDTFQPAGNQNTVGAGGRQIFRFRGEKIGISNLTLRYQRPWEAGIEPEETKVFEVTIE